MRHDEGKTVAKVVAYLCVAILLAPRSPAAHVPSDRYMLPLLIVIAVVALLWAYRDEIRGLLGRAGHS